MADFDTEATNRADAHDDSPRRPLIWSGIVSGALAALGVQLILTLIGMGVAGLNLSPSDGGPDTRMAVGAAIWLLISGIISFGFGGYVAGYISSFFRTTSGPIHGMLAWAAAAVVAAGVTAIAGSTALGGAAAGAGAAARDHRTQSVDSTQASTQPGFARDPRTGGATDPETRAAAQRAADATGKSALWTGLAFLVSMVAAAVGGKVGRGDHTRTLTEERPSRSHRVARA